MYEQIGFSVALLMIAYLAMQDIKQNEISLFVLILSGCVALLFLAAEERLIINEVTEKMLPGMLMLALSLLSKESIGYGDGATVLVLGLWTSMRYCSMATMIAIMMAGGYGIFLLINKKKEKRIPFIPFLLAAMEVLFLYA